MDYDVADEAYNNFVHKLIINEDKKNELLANPMHTDLALAQLSRSAMPKSKAAKMASNVNFDKAMLAIPKGDPRRLVFEGLREDMPKILRGGYGVAPETAILKETQRRLDNAKEDTYKYVQSNSGWFGDKVAPADNQEDYAQWVEKNPSMANPLSYLATGAAFQGAGTLLQSKTAGQLLAKAPEYTAKKAIPFLGKTFGLRTGAAAVGRMLAMAPPIGLPGGIAKGIGGVLMAAAALGGIDAIKVASAKAGHPLSTVEELAVGFPIYSGVNRLAKAGVNASMKSAASAAEKYGTNEMYSSIKTIKTETGDTARDYIHGAAQPPVSRADMQAAENVFNAKEFDKAMLKTKMDSWSIPNPEEQNALLLAKGDAKKTKEIMDGVIKRNASAEASKELATKQEIITEATKLTSTTPGLEHEDALKIASRKINPSTLETLNEMDFLKKMTPFTDDEVKQMFPRDIIRNADNWRQHSVNINNIINPKVPIVKEELFPFIKASKLEKTAHLTRGYEEEAPFTFKQGMPDTLNISEINNKYTSMLTSLKDISKKIIPANITSSVSSTASKIVPKSVPVSFEKASADFYSSIESAGKTILDSNIPDADKIGGVHRLFQTTEIKTLDLLRRFNKVGDPTKGEVLKSKLFKLQTSLIESVPNKEKVMQDVVETNTKLTNSMASTTTAAKTGTVTKERTITDVKKEIKQIIDKYLTPGKLATKEQLDNIPIEEQNKLVKLAKEHSKLIGGVAAVGLVSLGSLISPSSADAAPLPNANVMVPSAFKDLASNLGRSVGEYTEKIIQLTGLPERQGRVLTGQMHGTNAFIPKDIRVFEAKKSSVFDKFFSISTQDDVYMNAVDKTTGQKLPYGIGKDMVLRSQVIDANVTNELPLITDILKHGNIAPQLDEVAELFQPLVTKYHKRINIENPYWHGVADTMDKVLSGKFKSDNPHSSIQKISNAIRLSKGDLSILDERERAAYETIVNRKQEALDNIEKIKPYVDEFQREYDVYARTAASRFPTSRVALATDGYGMKGDDPWLQNLLQPNERVASEELKAYYEAKAVRMQETGHEVIKGDYMHHPAHPSVDYAEDLKHLETISSDAKEGMRLVNFFHRQSGSRLVVPDSHYVMGKYIPDVNKRIEISDMWKVGKPGGWWAAAKEMEAAGNYEGALRLIDSVRTAFDPADTYGAAKWLNKYASFEVARLLTLSPSVSFKHALKLMGNWTIFPADISVKATGLNFELQARQYAQDMAGNAFTGKDRVADLSRSLTFMHHTYAAVSDMAPYELPTDVYDVWLNKINKAGSSFVNLVERFDRGQTFISSMLMAQKKGMTPEQALFGLVDSVARVNFLTGPNNPTWLKDPFIRTMMMFQGTPFKILEQRLLTMYHGGKDVGNTLKLLGKLRSDVKTGEANFKWHMLKDELTRHKDIFGSNYSTQFLKQLMVIGAVVQTGKHVFDSEMWGHTVHIPGVQLGEKGVQLGLNPVVGAAYKTATGGNITPENEDDFWLSRFWQSWLGQSGFPAVAHKIANLKNDDIPDMYKDSKLNYLFGVPKRKDEED